MANAKYNDMIDLSKPISKKYPLMPREKRAVQFAPFAALTGYDACLAEEARLTGERIELSDEQLQLLNLKIAYLCDRLDTEPVVSITYFKQDPRKSGGEYVTVEGAIYEIEEIKQRIVLTDKTKIPIADILAIEIRPPV